MVPTDVIESSVRAIALLDPHFGPEAVDATRHARRGSRTTASAEAAAAHAVVVRHWKPRVRRADDPDAVLAWAIAQRIRRARGDKGWNQQDLAEASGIVRPNIVRLEHGRHLPSLATLQRVADALGLDLRALLTPPTPRLSAEDRVLAEADLVTWAQQLDEEDARA